MMTKNEIIETSPQEAKTEQSIIINRFAYGAFVLLAFYFLVFSEDKMNGIMQLGIALIFDPFDQTITFTKRPLYQRIWLILHLMILIAGFIFLAFLR